MINCIIIEDQFPAQRILKKYISEIPELNLVGTFSNALLAEEILNTSKIELLFLDIHLPKVSGIDFLKSIEKPPNVILTTAFSEYALEGYELNIVDYLLKPYSFERFKKAATKAIEIINLKENSLNTNALTESTSIFIKSGHEHFKINTANILFINSDSDYTDIHTQNNMYISSESLKYWEQKLSEFHFLRVHKSYIINTQKIIKTSAQYIYIEDGHKIPIGRTYKNNVLVRLALQ